MWNSFRTDQALAITAEITTFRAGRNETIHAYVARPTTGGAHPGLVVIHHTPGWDEFHQEFSERLARHGYIVIAPDLYCRFGHGTPDDVFAKARAEGGVHDDSVVADSEAALKWLRSRPDFNGRAGVIGSCSGGRHSLLVASRVPHFDAVVDLWGGDVVPRETASATRPVAPLQYTVELSTPLLGIFGNDDKHPSPEDVEAHEAELKRHGRVYEFHRWDGAGHGFMCHDSSLYRPEAAMEAWATIFGFLEKHLVVA
jgi:carboxymethylenebutenolidase